MHTSRVVDSLENGLASVETAELHMFGIVRKVAAEKVLN